MTSEIIAVLLESAPVILGAVVAGLASWLASKSVIRAEIEKLRLGLRHIQAQPLQTERLRTYPILYRLLSGCAKEIHAKGVGSIDLVTLRAEVDDWDSSYSLLLSVPSTRAIYEFRRYVASLAQDEKSLKAPDVQYEFFQNLEKAELALKADLAVLGLDFYNPEHVWASYSEVNQEFDRSRQQ